MFSLFGRRRPQVRVFLATEMNWTLFQPKARAHPRLLKGGVVFVDTAEAADVLVSTRVDALIPYGGLDRAFLVWTREPRVSTVLVSPFACPGILRPVHVMNCYTGDLNVTPLAYVDEPPLDREAAIRSFRAKRPRTAMLATHVAGRDLYVGARNLDLNAYRVAVATHLNARGGCDVYGRNWPAPVKVSGESRGKGWVHAKRAILSAYQVNIAIENTCWRYYITEKIWQAISGACLPVYYGDDNGIAEVFPRDSFIEACGLTPAALHDRIERMATGERVERFVACVDAMNVAVAQARELRPDDAMADRTVARLHAIGDARGRDAPAA